MNHSRLIWTSVMHNNESERLIRKPVNYAESEDDTYSSKKSVNQTQLTINLSLKMIEIIDRIKHENGAVSRSRVVETLLQDLLMADE